MFTVIADLKWEPLFNYGWDLSVTDQGFK